MPYFCTLLVEACLMRICKSDLSWAQVPSQSQFYVLCWVLSHQPIRCIHRVLDALISCTFYRAYIRLPTSNAPGPALIEREERFFPFLSIALVLSMVPMSLYICLLKCFALHIGTERASHLRMCLRLFLLNGDSSISCLDWRATFRIIVYTMTLGELTSSLKGRYYLADAIYADSDDPLVLYLGVRYHLKDWEKVREKYASALSIPVVHHQTSLPQASEL